MEHRDYALRPRDGVGIQLIIFEEMVRDDFGVVARLCPEAGYNYVEGNLTILDVPATKARERLSDHGLKVQSIHVDNPRIADETRLAETLRYVQECGAGILISSGLEPGRSYEDAAPTLNRVGMQCKSQGITYYYHCNYWEFQRDENGVRGIDRLLENTDAELVKYNLDILWARAVGEEPSSLVTQLGERCDYYHLKDGVFGSSPDAVEFCRLGRGQVDIPACLEAIRRAVPSPYLVVEQDEVEEDESRTASSDITDSRRYLAQQLGTP